MIKADDIRHLRTASPDYADTEALKAGFRKHRAERIPFWLDAADFDRIFHWKLRGPVWAAIRKEGAEQRRRLPNRGRSRIQDCWSHA